jgi:hypothetical protein
MLALFGSNARKRILDGSDIGLARRPDSNHRGDGVANQLAILVAHETARAESERERRIEMEEVAAELAVMLAREHKALQRVEDEVRRLRFKRD